jgi:hypothetical protein
MAGRQRPLFLRRSFLLAPFRESPHEGLNSVRLLRVGMWSMAQQAETHPGVLSGKRGHRNLDGFECWHHEDALT